MKDEYLVLYEDCKMVRGYRSHLIYDFTRNNNSNFVPSSFVDFIERCANYSLKEVLASYSNLERNIVEEYCVFIEKREFGLRCDGHLKKGLVPLRLEFDTPELIENAIIQFMSMTILKKIILLLDEALCSAVEIRIATIDERELILLLECFDESIVESIEVHIDEAKGISSSFFQNNFHRLKHLYIYNDSEPSNHLELTHVETGMREALENCVSKKKKIVNKWFYIESQKHHTYFNKKLYFDPHGNIKNSPECIQVVGNIKNIAAVNDLELLINNSSLKQYWNVNKEMCDVCKHCEYRHMCVDSRVPIFRNKNEYYHDIPCEYNPYINKWQGEEGFHTLEHCGVISNEREFTIDPEKIAAINLELWGV
jgi:SPASM domain peptide maturase of grasp-with-spasm system